MKKKLFLHVGMSKTGTTSIQSGLLTYKKALEDLGFYYPTGVMSHNLVSRHFKGVKRFDQQLAKFVEDVEATDCHSVVMSSEMFERMPPKGWLEFKETFSKFDIQIVIYLRRQADVMVSMYSELVKKHVVSTTFETYLKTAPRLNLLDYKEVLERLFTPFGRENISARAFSREALVQQDPFLDFLHTIGADLGDKVVKNKHSNASFSGATTKIIQVVNKNNEIEIDHFKNYRLACRLGDKTNKLIQDNYGDVERISEVKHGFKDAESFEAFQAQYAESNAWVETHFLNGHKLSAGSKPAISKNLAKDDMIDIYDDLLKDIIGVYIKRYGVVRGRAKAVGKLWQLILDEDSVS